MTTAWKKANLVSKTKLRASQTEINNNFLNLPLILILFFVRSAYLKRIIESNYFMFYKKRKPKSKKVEIVLYYM